MRKLFTSVIAVCILAANASASNPFHLVSPPLASGQKAMLRDGDYVKGTVIIKMKPETRGTCRLSGIDIGSVNEKFALLSVSGIMKRFPRAQAFDNQRNSSGEKLVDLSLIYTVRYSSSLPIEEALSILKSDPAIEYAEPQYISHMSYTPNEPSANLALQYFLNNIQAYNAWDIWKGDTNTVIGIVDSGTDWDHPDLAANVKNNYADPIDGVDNDADGFTDNFRGWDVSENDNDPTVGNSDHGSHVSGCAAAVTDNGTGVASPSFKCKFMGIKSSLDASTTSIDNGYDGITYAADHGCHVINLSWGRGGGFSEFEQDVINYATINQDVAVIAAAGNNGIDEKFFPASYQNVTSVASTGSNDGKSSFSNYNFSVDVCAPGDNIYSTIYNNNYTFSSGTSMASPIAAGCAAMIKSRFPSFNAFQIAAQLRNTSDNIYSVAQNSSFSNKLGKGRVNMFKAVTDTTSPAVVASIASLTDGNDNTFVGNDTLSLIALFKNWLRPTTNLTCVLTAQSNQVTVLQNTFTAGVINMFDTITNFASAYRIRIKPTAPINAVVPMKITMTDGTWTDFFSFSIIVNVDYVNIEVNDISTSQTSKCRIGYNSPGQVDGLGFKYIGTATLYEMSLMIGDGTHEVSDGVRNDGTANGGYDEDFESSIRVSEQTPTVSDYYAYGKFAEGGITSTNPMNILVTHHSYAWVNNPDKKYVMVEYVVKNIGTSSLNNVYAGLMADWDIPQYANNKADEDAARKMGYVFSTDGGGLYCGMKLLTSTAAFRHYAIDNVAGGNGGLDLYAGGYDDNEKYTSMSTARAQAGNTVTTGNDVIDVVSSGPYSIAAGDSFVVAFALIGGESLASIQASADAAQDKYDNLHTGLAELPHLSVIPFSVYPNPVNRSTTFNFSVEESSQVKLSVFNLLGDRMKTLIDEKLTTGNYSSQNDLSSLPAGNYLAELQVGKFKQVLKLVIVR